MKEEIEQLVRKCSIIPCDLEKEVKSVSLAPQAYRAHLLIRDANCNDSRVFDELTSESVVVEK